MTTLHNHIDDSLDSDYNDSTRTVLLHQHTDGYSGSSFTTAAMDTRQATVTRMTSGNKPKQLRLSTIEADAFVKAWTQFKADIETAKAVKTAKQQADLASAYALAREMREHLGELGTLEIHVDNRPEKPIYNQVKLPAIDWSYYNPGGRGYRIVDGTELLKAVKEALGKIAGHIDILKATPENQRTHWNEKVTERNDRWIATWDVAQAWLESVKAAHFTSAKEETTPDYDEAMF